MPKFLKYAAVLIGTYLVVANYTGSAAVTRESFGGAGNLVKAFQGR